MRSEDYFWYVHGIIYSAWQKVPPPPRGGRGLFDNPPFMCAEEGRVDEWYMSFLIQKKFGLGWLWL